MEHIIKHTAQTRQPWARISDEVRKTLAYGFVIVQFVATLAGMLLVLGLCLRALVFMFSLIGIK